MEFYADNKKGEKEGERKRGPERGWCVDYMKGSQAEYLLVIPSLVVLLVLVDEGQTAAATGVPVVVNGHEGGGAAAGVGALATETGDLVVLVHLVVLQHRQLDLLVLVLLHLGLAVGLLLLFLGTTTQTKHQVERGLRKAKQDTGVRQ